MKPCFSQWWECRQIIDPKIQISWHIHTYINTHRHTYIDAFHRLLIKFISCHITFFKCKRSKSYTFLFNSKKNHTFQKVFSFLLWNHSLQRSTVASSSCGMYFYSFLTLLGMELEKETTTWGTEEGEYRRSRWW